MNLGLRFESRSVTRTRMTWVKICGITDLEDALTAVQAGADALGFVFHEKSPRCVSPQTAHDIARHIPDTIEKVGVFVGSPGKFVFQIADHVGLTAIQTHVDSFSENAYAEHMLASDSVTQYLALSAHSFFERTEDLEEFLMSHVNRYMPFRADAVFLDSGTSQNPGGTGQVFDWGKAIPLGDTIQKAGFKLVVAGGLTPENVAVAMQTLRPWGVDVSSGVEERPGKKDAEKVRAFIAAVRNADKG
jgi:phosphoribosylanthranilate isomerase